VAVEPGLHASATYAAAGLHQVTAIERGARNARIVLVRVATSDPQRKGTTILIDRAVSVTSSPALLLIDSP
jgi:predicted 2-oxoglutarate/Fe(II)-dependent dioxygenase YbiX